MGKRSDWSGSRGAGAATSRATATKRRLMDVLGLQRRLRLAVESLSPPAQAAPRNLPYQQSPQALALVLMFWADGFIRDLERLDRLLTEARQAETLEAATLPLEEAFWRVDAACEKLRSLVFCALGIESSNRCRGRLRPQRRDETPGKGLASPSDSREI